MYHVSYPIEAIELNRITFIYIQQPAAFLVIKEALLIQYKFNEKIKVYI